MFLVDSHCHLNLLNYETTHQNVNQVIDNAINEQVRYMLAVATSLEGYEQMTELVGANPHVGFSCGVHPCYVKDAQYELDKFRELASKEHVLALGETGLDYYHETDTLRLQQQRFSEHIQLGAELNKPIIIHTRSARKDTLAMLKSEDISRCGGVLHCFTEDIDTARAVLDLGLYISFSGIVTFKNARELQEVAKFVPIDRMLIETDSPYLAPVPFRGKENQPANVRHVATFLANLKSISIESLAENTTKNFCQMTHLSYDALLSV
ncbi:YchF/TatD family DNA exonuclease [Thorsellia anophelis]|uniref:YchF/TatD family DNA exonuclease n=1 Tax=Thorsellia anophelis TaxID=336804 RepID=UPI000B83AA20|nr:YchF/TatD family DNA exonuclease [Thorsellia anophelis]